MPITTNSAIFTCKGIQSCACNGMRQIILIILFRYIFSSYENADIRFCNA